MTGRRPLVIHNTFIMVPVEREIADAINSWVRTNLQSFDAALAPFGLSSFDLKLPDWQRVVWEDECPERSGEFDLTNCAVEATMLRSGSDYAGHARRQSFAVTIHTAARGSTAKTSGTGNRIMPAPAEWRGA